MSGGQAKTGKLMANTFKSDRGAFNKGNASFMDMLQAKLAMNIEVLIKTSGEIPVKTGLMRSQVRHFSLNKGYRVEADASYSAAQEAGERNGVRFKNYSQAGTGPHWFQHAIDATISAKDSFVEEVKKALNI